jgi:tetratricopeptide (TPR) repeat protein
MTRSGFAFLIFLFACLIGNSAHAQQGTICANRQALDNETRRTCQAVVLACGFNPEVLGTRMRGENFNEALAKCINNAFAKSKAWSKPESSRAPCDHFGGRGLDYADANKWDLAMADFDRAIRSDRTCAKAFFGRAMVYLNRQSASSPNPRTLGLALDDLSRYIDLPSDGEDRTARLSAAFFMRGEIHLAYANTAAKGPVDLNTEKASFQKISHQLDLALADCSRAVEINPNYADARECRATAAEQHRKVMDANQKFDGAMRALDSVH